MNADSGSCSTGDRSSLWAFQCSAACVVSSAPTWPTISLTVRKPNWAISSRTSSAMNMKKFSTNSGLPLKRFAQHRVLGRDADRTGVEVADPHHDAARHHQRRGREAELLGAEQRGDHDVAAGLELTVDLHDDAIAKTVEQQRLLGLGQPELPRRARVLHAMSAGWRRCRRRGPEISTTSACAFDTPAATVPTPFSQTSFTCTRACGLEFFRSWISCARSSIE